MSLINGHLSSSGEQGIQGNTGIQGYTGLAGSAGSTGVAGAGFTGIQGVTGPGAGSQGVTGLRGFTGFQGTTGQGVQGTTGPQVAVTRAINAQSGTTYTFALTDGSNNGNNPLVTFGSASATTITIPTNATVGFPIGSQVECIQVGAGKVTFGGAGVTINSVSSNKAIGAQYAGVTLIKTATDTWSLIGSLQA